uniref:NADH-ubiquinone oxidoreductase chain 3 n=1 Tax=Arion vulgaris TaxID=1028688 RepID=A0A6C0AAM3_9EUPU|nr:NADH dehydrogenase subunit 3 [Arion vulgaris]QHS71056.1 NADH dehydrogenase subunit 3 [Arion vulgaris]
MIFYFMLGMLISVCFLSLSTLIYQTSIQQSDQKMSAFECGFDPLSYPRSPFSTRYFVLILIFLVFDVETVLLLPILSKEITTSHPHVMLSLCSFLFILLLGLMVEWYQGALEWH